MRICFSCVRNGFYFVLRSILAGRSAQTYEECSNLRIISLLGLFLQLLGQVKKWLILELHKMIRMSRAVAYLIIFILLCDLGQQKAVFKLMKNCHFLVFLPVSVFSRTFLGNVKEWFILELHGIIRVSNCVPICFYFVLWSW